MRSPAIILCLLVIACTSPLSGQREPPVAASQRVRVTSSAFSGTGMVSSLRNDTLAIMVENLAAPVLIPFPTIHRLDVRRQNSTGQGAMRGALWGAAIGGGVGLLSLVFADESDDESDDEPDLTEFFIPSPGVIIVSTAVTGGVIGAAWGAIRPGGRWERVSLEVVLRASPRSVGVAALRAMREH